MRRGESLGRPRPARKPTAGSTRGPGGPRAAQRPVPSPRRRRRRPFLRPRRARPPAAGQAGSGPSRLPSRRVSCPTERAALPRPAAGRGWEVGAPPGLATSGARRPPCRLRPPSSAPRRSARSRLWGPQGECPPPPPGSRPLHPPGAPAARALARRFQAGSPLCLGFAPHSATPRDLCPRRRGGQRSLVQAIRCGRLESPSPASAGPAALGLRPAGPPGGGVSAPGTLTDATPLA